LQRDVDLIEEVLRAYGIDKIPGRTRGASCQRARLTVHMISKHFVLRHRLRDPVFRSRTSKLISRSALASNKAIELRNPLSEDHVALRPNLISGLLDVLERNIRAGAESVSFFEIGRCIPPSGRRRTASWILLWGNIAKRIELAIADKSEILDLFDLKARSKASSKFVVRPAKLS
jgi:phenylalanyl-tRNA synthetase beta chain